MKEQEFELGPSTKMRLATFVALIGLIVAPLVALLVKVERVDIRLERIESHIMSDWTFGHMMIWSSKLAELNRTNGFAVPDPENIRKAFQP